MGNTGRAARLRVATRGINYIHKLWITRKGLWFHISDPEETPSLGQTRPCPRPRPSSTRKRRERETSYLAINGGAWGTVGMCWHLWLKSHLDVSHDCCVSGYSVRVEDVSFEVQKSCTLISIAWITHSMVHLEISERITRFPSYPAAVDLLKTVEQRRRHRRPPATS